MNITFLLLSRFCWQFVKSTYPGITEMPSVSMIHETFMCREIPKYSTTRSIETFSRYVHKSLLVQSQR